MASKEPEPREAVDAIEPPGEALVDLAGRGGDHLLVLRSPQADLVGRHFVLSLDALSIGSGEGNHIQVKDADVASLHAVMLRTRKDWHVLDAGTLLGTYRNGILLTAESRLRDGDQLQVGQTLFQFRTVQEEAEAPPPQRSPPEPAWDRAWGRNERHRAYPGREARKAGPPVKRRIRAWLEECQMLIETVAPGLSLFEEPTSGFQALCDSLEREIVRATRHDRPLSLALLDIGGLDEVEEAHGRGIRLVASQRALAHVKETLVAGEIAVGLVDRIGVILPDRGANEAAARGDELRRALEEHRFEIDRVGLRLQAKVGVATRLEGEDNPVEIVTRAVEALEGLPAP